MGLSNAIYAMVLTTQGVVNDTQNLNMNKISEIERKVKRIKQMAGVLQ